MVLLGTRYNRAPAALPYNSIACIIFQFNNFLRVYWVCVTLVNQQ